MSWQIDIARAARKELADLRPQMQVRIAKAILSLKTIPLHMAAKSSRTAMVSESAWVTIACCIPPIPRRRQFLWASSAIGAKFIVIDRRRMMLLGQEIRRDVILLPAMKLKSTCCKLLGAQYTGSMTPIAIELDQKIKSFDPETAASVERLVRDALHLAESKHASVPKESHREFIQRMTGAFGEEPFERPPQGEFEKREDW